MNPSHIKNVYKHQNTLITKRSNDLPLSTLVLIYCMMKKSFECCVEGSIKIAKFSHNVEKNIVCVGYAVKPMRVVRMDNLSTMNVSNYQSFSWSKAYTHISSVFGYTQQICLE